MHPNILSVFVAQGNPTKTPGKMYRMLKDGGGEGYSNGRKKMNFTQEKFSATMLKAAHNNKKTNPN